MLKIGLIVKHKIHGYQLKILNYNKDIYKCVCLDNTPLMHTILYISKQNIEGLDVHN